MPLHFGPNKTRYQNQSNNFGKLFPNKSANSSDITELIYCNATDPLESHLKLKSRKISFAHSYFSSCSIASKVTLSCIMPTFKKIEYADRVLWTNVYLRQLLLLYPPGSVN